MTKDFDVAKALRSLPQEKLDGLIVKYERLVEQGNEDHKRSVQILYAEKTRREA